MDDLKVVVGSDFREAPAGASQSRSILKGVGPFSGETADWFAFLATSLRLRSAPTAGAIVSVFSKPMARPYCA
ncbi:hypothetical protein HFO55_30945 [Rhizobium leguminosarum]|uniref:hypothetical protein n=1 Tax=Rhizobium leguminosarum TaxID=384 RepID=UPI001C970235|nr:hypothetical protein [Rhizobium leguminosarum]MBY5571580.1 hypothetical protein [Rhizobium leguminosarum]MBY5578822.1 hypothetical protein [Rhizobium leguminosarum]MBY5700421.1 hypothetical protein [Rhizobium leguminosarum]